MDTLTITFDERPESVTLRQSPVSLNEYFAVREAIEAATWDNRASIEAVYAALEPMLVAWDFEPPPTAAGLAELDVILAMTIAATWRDEVRSVPRPLARRSSDGEPSPEP